MQTRPEMGPLLATNSYGSPFSRPRFDDTAKQLAPALMAEARKIRTPTYIGPEDLVQEAMLQLFTRRKAFDTERKRFRAWSLAVARNRYLTLALTAWRARRQAPTSVPWTDELAERPELPRSENEGFLRLRYHELVEEIESRLKPTARRVFRAMVDQPEELLEAVRREHHQALRRYHTGRRGNRPTTLRLSNQVLADHLELSYATVASAKQEIERVTAFVCRS